MKYIESISLFLKQYTTSSVMSQNMIRETALHDAILKTERLTLFIACTINLLAVSTVFMTQAIFLELAESFHIDIAQARFSFSIVSLLYSVSFFFLGPVADKIDLPKIAATGLLLLSMTVFSASYAVSFSVFLLSMGLMGMCAACIPASIPTSRRPRPKTPSASRWDRLWPPEHSV